MDHEKDLLLEKLFDHFIIICLLYSFIPYNQIGIPKIDAKQETGIGPVCLSNMTLNQWNLPELQCQHQRHPNQF